MERRSSAFRGALPGILGGIPAGAAICALLFLSPAHAAAPSPTEQIRGAIDRVIGILNRADLKSKAKEEERRKLLREQIQPVFDFGEMAKRSLGVNWRDRSPQERERFTALFTELLENSYLGKIESYNGERIRYAREKVDGSYAEVDTTIVVSGRREIPVVYRLLGAGDRWRIYDVEIEGISLVNNYRSQFKGILAKSSFEELMNRLRSTVKRSGERS